MLSTINVNRDLRSDDWGTVLDSATAEVFEMMLNCKLVPSHGNQHGAADITAVVGLAGQLCGAFTLKCSSRAAILMTAAMLGIPAETVDHQEWDAVGEVCNMLAGNFKAKLNGVGDRCMLSVPTVVSGADYTVRMLVNGAAVERQFLFQGEPICLAVQVER